MRACELHNQTRPTVDLCHRNDQVHQPKQENMSSATNPDKAGKVIDNN